LDGTAGAFAIMRSATRERTSREGVLNAIRQMLRSISKRLSLISAMCLACTIILWVGSYWTEPLKDSLSLSNAFHITVCAGRVEFFNIKEAGPYHGSIIALSDGFHPVFSERRAFGDAFGVYYRYFRWANSGVVYWTLSVTLLYPFLVFAVLPTIWAWKSWKARRRRPVRPKEVGPRQHIQVAIRMYWWTGVMGAAACSIVACRICAPLICRTEPPSLDSLGVLGFFCVSFVIFAASIHVARRLTTRPEGMLPYARMVGIILATAWFPILTLPGIICVRRVTRHFVAYCESRLPDAGGGL
jgi:hypothetical protein